MKLPGPAVTPPFSNTEVGFSYRSSESYISQKRNAVTPHQAIRIIESAIDNSNIELNEGSELTEALNTLWDLILLGKEKAS